MIKQGIFGCFEVTIGWYGKERCDFITYDTNNTWKCYEIKSSVEDFHSKSAHTFCGHYNYYVTTDEVYEKIKDEISSHIGVYTLSGNWVTSVKKAKRQELNVDEKILKDSFIRSLFRQAEKYYYLQDQDKIIKYKRTIDKLKKEISEYKYRYINLRNAIIEKLGHDTFKSLYK